MEDGENMATNTRMTNAFSAFGDSFYGKTPIKMHHLAGLQPQKTFAVMHLTLIQCNEFEVIVHENGRYVLKNVQECGKTPNVEMGMKVQSRRAKRCKMQFLLNLLRHEVHPHARTTHPFSGLFPFFLS